MGKLVKGLGIVGLALFVAVFLLLTGHGSSGGLRHGGRLSAPTKSLGVLPAGSIPVNAPVFVVGPDSLLSLVRGLLPNASVAPITLGRLPETPNGSVVVIDWGYIRPLLVSGRALNLSSPALGVLSRLFSRGDFVALYGNASDEGLMGIALAIAWARGVNNELVLYASNSYAFRMLLTAVPLIPVRGEIMEVAYGGKGWLAITPIHTNQLMSYVIPYIMIRNRQINILTMMQNADPVTDPCWELWYNQFYPASSNGVYENNRVMLIWLAPQWGGLNPNYYGNSLEAYQDGNGTFYIDSCIEFNNNGGTGDGTAIISVSVNNYIDYALTSTAVNNGGFEDWQLGAMDYYTGYEDYVNGQSNAIFGSYNGLSGVQPQSTSSTAEYSVSVGIGLEGLELEFIVTLPSGSSESISLAAPQSTYYQVPFINLGFYEDNFTWAFSISNGNTAAEGYYNAFVDTFGDAELFIPSFNPSNSYLAILPVYFENLVVTSEYWVLTRDIWEPYCNYELMWTDALWNVAIIPTTQISTNSYLFNFNYTAAGYIVGNAPVNSYLTGLTTGTAPCYNLPSSP